MLETTHQPYSRPVMRAIVLCSFLTALGVTVLSFVLPLVSLDAKVSGGWLGTGFAGFFFARLIMGPLGGWWADRASARTPLLFSCGMGVVAPALYFLQPYVSTLYIVQFFLGITSGLFRPVGLAVLGYMGEERELSGWFSYHALAFHGALFVGPLLAGFVLLKSDIRPLLGLTSLLMACAFVIVWWIVPPGVKTIRKDDSHRERGSLFWGLLTAIFGRSLGIGLTVAFYPIWLAMNVGRDGLLVGVLFSLPGLAVCLGLILLQKPSGLVRAVVGLLVSSGCLFFIGVCSSTWQFAIAGLMLGMGSALSLPETMRLASSAYADQGKAFGATHLAAGLGLVLGPLAGGVIVQLAHDAGLAFMVVGIVGWFSCLGLLEWGWLNGAKRFFAKEFIIVGGVIALLLVGVVHESQKHVDDGLYRYSEVAMGTVVKLTLEARSQKAADNAARKAMSYIRIVQNDLDYRIYEGSVGRINRAAGKHFVKPTSRAYSLIQRAIAYSEISDGVFDPTIGALTTSPLYYALDETVAEAKKGLVDYKRVSFDNERQAVRLDRAGMALDLGGIAKGTIIDGTVRLLRGLGISAGIVEAGGDFYCFGDRQWTIGIRHPRVEEVYTSVTVREKGVCGSGDYIQFVEVGSEGETSLRHHIINPADMAPASESIGVSVIADNAELADVLATTVFIMGAEKGSAFIGEHYPGADAVWFLPDGTTSATTSFPN